MMDHFNYTGGVLHAEGLALPELAQQVGTPFYCYSRATLERHIQVFMQSLEGLDALTCYAVKANSNLAILKLLAAQGAGADVVSEGEIRRALAAGIAPEKIVFSGVGKQPHEMLYALNHHILQFNVESEAELLTLNEIALSQSRQAPIAIRINPDVDAGTHAKISTGKKENKFGVPIDLAPALYEKAKHLPGIHVQGVSMHIGSQLTSLAPFRAAYARAAELVKQLRSDGHRITHLDIGGGLGVPYQTGDLPPLPAEYGEMVKETVGDLGCHLILEPGRMIVANAGVLVTRVIYVKETGSKRFVVVDAAMNDLLRPAMYDAYHAIVPVNEYKGALTPADIVGPVCETGDTFATDRPLAPVLAGDLLIFRTAGAYGASMSNGYNSRLLVPEVLVDHLRYAIIRPRPSYDAMLAAEQIPDWLKDAAQ